MFEWICKNCGSHYFGWADIPKTCPNCGVKTIRSGNLFTEEEDKEDHYSFWDQNPLRRGFKNWTWGPFGKRRR